MVGGTRPPVGLEWKVVALTKHHGNIIRLLATTEDSPLAMY